MQISIRQFKKEDIPNKVKWINDPENNQYLHYDLPLEIEKTEAWFEKNKERTDRYDAVIEADGISVGIIGLLSIDLKNKKAEYYITIGNRDYRGKNIAVEASRKLLQYAFNTLGLKRVYLYTESDNIAAVRCYEKIGFKREGLIKQDLFTKGRYVDRYIYGITSDDFYGHKPTPIYFLKSIGTNRVYVKRDDLLPFSFGGNKARKAELFFEEIDRGEYDCVVTYGSGSSNHCRVVSNMAASRGMKCFIISPEETLHETNNSKLMNLFGAEIIVCQVSEVADTIEEKLQSLRKNGSKPYFIAGGGHGNIGTQAYVNCYEEIRQYEKEMSIHFDYIFHASGTGTTQAGLICGKLINREERDIVGISIARKNPRGRDVVLESVSDYLNTNKVSIDRTIIEDAIYFLDDYVSGRYGDSSEIINDTIRRTMMKHGLPLDSTYTGKAYAGMVDYIDKNAIEAKNILFLHTGGGPLFFDFLNQ